MLFAAIRNRDVESVRNLLRSGANVKVKGRGRGNDDDNRHLLLLLINSLTGWFGIKENAKVTMPILLVATETENTQIVALLLDYGADVNSYYGRLCSYD
jgi:ankyrin repeat protein